MVIMGSVMYLTYRNIVLFSNLHPANILNSMLFHSE